MRILEWHIDRFGGLKNLTHMPAPGFNLLLGKNEDGKSTLMAFIRAMFYGLNSAAHNILENDRKRLMPWGEASMSGWLVLELSGRRYRIERTFGLSRRFDRSVLRDETSGLQLDLPARQEIGEYLFSVSEQEFINTVFIGQLATADVNPDGGTLAKLTNLAATGDELLSSDEIDTRIRKAMVRLKAEKGNGGLINVHTARLEQLTTERQMILQQESTRSECFLALRELMNERDHTMSHLKEAQHLLGLCQDWALIQHAETRAEFDNALQHMQSEIDRATLSLTGDGHLADQALITELRTKQTELTAGHAQIEEMERIRQRLLEQKIQLFKAAETHSAVNQIDQSILASQIAMQRQLEEDLLTVRRLNIDLREIQSSEAEHQAIIRQASEKRASLDDALDAFRAQMAFEYQQASDETEARATAYAAQKEELAKVRNTREADLRLKHSVVTGLVACVLLIIFGVIVGWKVHPLAYTLIPLGLAVGLFFGLRAWKINRTGNALQIVERAALTRLLLASGQALEESQMRQKTLQIRHEQREIQLISQRAASQRSLEIAEAARSRESEEWAQNIERIVQNPIWQRFSTVPQQCAMESELLTAIVADRVKCLAETVQAQFEQSQQNISDLIKQGGCHTLDELFLRSEQLQDIKSQLIRLDLSLSQADKEIAAASDEIEAKEQSLMCILLNFFPNLTCEHPDIFINEMATELRHLDELKITFAERQSASQAMKSNQASGQISQDTADTKSRLVSIFPDAPHDLLAALKQFMHTQSLGHENAAAEMDMSDVDAYIEPLARRVDEIRINLHSQDASCIRAESDLKSRFASIRNLEEIDSEIQHNEARLKMMQSDYDALGLARKTVGDAFHSLQQSFGPQLNQRSGEILSALTGGRYQAMRVDRSFDIHVAEPGTGVLREWAYLSGGTVDQVYLSLRLAVAELIGRRENRLPLCLDDVFVQYDDQRALAGLEYLQRYAEEQNLQVLLFSCHERLNRSTAVIPVRVGSD